MTHQIESDTAINALVVTTFGEATIAGFRSYIEETLADPRWTPGMNVLGDYSRLDTSTLSSKDMQQLAAIHIANDERIGPGFHAYAWLREVTGKSAVEAVPDCQPRESAG